MAVTMKRKRLINPSKVSTRAYLQTLVDSGLARRRTTRMVAGAFYIPKHNPAKPLGEDSHFVCSEAQTIGVGGWAKRGIDAGEYSRELMANAVLSVCHQRDTVGCVDPMTALDEAYVDTKAQGSCTACILTLVDDCLNAVNVGDSGFALLRAGKIVYTTPPQQSRFNCPFQLGKSRGDPTAAEKFEVKVKPGDIIVMTTDGLFDNVHESELEDLVNGSVSNKNPMKLARKFARYALKNFLNGNIDTPFSAATRIARIDEHAIGGKYDDITVVVAYIQ
ncbi:PREDICTED: probable protein phosphatase 2C 55 [Ipomoea nil]|uniref:probable protein phosphatase 2C 55 n=1 Tax=Ipomoea nil TaxID=35883 RepID=UPI0009016CF6|nr:PREDICTED: probable protein phosphatase 2C 55 [Ipomoea nil]